MRGSSVTTKRAVRENTMIRRENSNISASSATTVRSATVKSYTMMIPFSLVFSTVLTDARAL